MRAVRVTRNSKVVEANKQNKKKELKDANSVSSVQLRGTAKSGNNYLRVMQIVKILIIATFNFEFRDC